MIMEFKSDVNGLTRQELLTLLKSEAVKIHITHIMKACNYLIDEGKYVQPNYREKFYNAYIQSFILRVKEIKKIKMFILKQLILKNLKIL